MNNWELKSQHLLSELVKYQSYVESLREGMSLRLKKRGEKVLQRALEHPADEDDDETGMARPTKKGLPLTPGQSGTNVVTSGTNTLGRRSSAVRPSLQVHETIQEAEEPLTPAAGGQFGTLHRRESADPGR